MSNLIVYKSKLFSFREFRILIFLMAIITLKVYNKKVCKISLHNLKYDFLYFSLSKMTQNKE